MAKKAISVLKDDFHNTARIFAHYGPAYYNGPSVYGYRLVLSADYDKNTVYHVSMHDSIEKLLDYLKTFSSGTFVEVNLRKAWNL